MTLTEVDLPKVIVLQHSSAVDFLAVAYPTLRQHERTANIVLAPALKCAPAEYLLTDDPIPADTFWLTVWSQPAKGTPVLELVVSCVDSSLGKYPIFLWTPVEQSIIPSQWMNSIAAHLRACVDPARVFAVFGVETVVNTFASVWQGLTGIPIASDPLYTAFFAFCTPQTLKATNSVGTARRAIMTDVYATAKLCYEFAAGSKYPLSADKARVEAEALTLRGQLWVYETQLGDIASICAVTRTSLHVSAITKVYTSPELRRKGFAQDLVQQVTQRLFECGKNTVVLYVGFENSAQRVYEHVGFVVGTDIWLELGFVGTDAGHW
ncbi:hypothetical protein C8R43DRAFT_1086633 [Mycena crocata]|nr:hypothetical protein C8R43DRAFT_1086633 [Mycena crocata]